MKHARRFACTIRALGPWAVTLALCAALAWAGAASLAACAHEHDAASPTCPACNAARLPGVLTAPPVVTPSRRVPMGRILLPPVSGALGVCVLDSVSPRGPPKPGFITNA